MPHNNPDGSVHKTHVQPEQPLRGRNLPLRHPGVWLAVALGGAAGALMRYGWSLPFQALSADFPWAVYTENILGAFLLGWLLRVFQRRLGRHRLVRAFLGTGLIGSFTTFSAITVDMGRFYLEAAHMLVWLYPLVSVLAGLAAAAAGWYLGRHTHPPEPVKRLTHPPESFDRKAPSPDASSASKPFGRHTHPPESKKSHQ